MPGFKPTSMVPSNDYQIALFGPQVTNWTQQGLSALQAALSNDPKLAFLKQTLADLPSLWSILKDDYGLHGFSAVEKLQELRGFAQGTQDLEPKGLTNTQLSTLTVVSQAVNYIQSTESSGTHYGVFGFEVAQGFCIGFLSAAALASANDWTQFERNFSNSLRLAACIGIIVDAERESHIVEERATAIHVRWKTSEDRAFLDTYLDFFPGAYVSCITDDRSITVTLPSASQVPFCSRLRDAKITTTSISLNGSYHHSSNAKAAGILGRICTRNEALRLPNANSLRLPLRSTADGAIISSGALHDIAIQTILCKRAHWYQTVKSTMNDLPQGTIAFVPLGGDSCVPRSLSLKDSHTNVLSDHDEPTPLEEIAVVGMSCRFPKAQNLEELRDLLWAGKTAIGKLPLDRFSPAKLSREPKLNNFWGNFLDNPDAFDHRFFGISGREAKSMDPQQRLALQVAYEALEASGYCSTVSNSEEADVGCYLGVGAVDYEDNIACHDANAFAATGTLRAFISGRISHFFGWTGPSLTFDTACSSSAVAIHTACKALLGGECSMALAGGVNVITSPNLHQNLAAASFLNPNGSSRAFDADGNGYCRGEGAGILVLKPLSKAIADGNTVLGVIAASAVNQGSNCSNITVPDSGSQSQLYKRVLSDARIAPKEVSYVEAHGTGTPVGDPVEYESVRLALAGSDRLDEVYLGSVKDNIGHTEAASGVAAVIKTLLMMQYKTIPKQANFVSLNPRIKAHASEQIIVPKVTQSWTGFRHVALVNNYGAAGSNAALLIRAHSDSPSSPLIQTPLGTQDYQFLFSSVVSPILLSARTASSLQSYMDMLKSRLPNVETSLGSVAYKVAQTHNPSFEHRIAFTAGDVNSAMSFLESSTAAADGAVVRANKDPVVLCFGGQVSRNVRVSRELYERSDLFRSHLDECNAICKTLGLPSILPSIFNDGDVQDMVLLHCMLLSLQVSSARSWIDCGLVVDTVIGHSFGQLAALCIAESITLKDMFLFVSGRARLIQDSWGLERGIMLSVECDKGEIDSVVDTVNSASGLRVDIACYNGPRSFVLAGDGPSMNRAEKECQTFKKTRLRNSHAYHSYLTDDILDPLLTVSKSIKMRSPRIRIETCSTGGTWAEFTAEKLVRHMREPVYFGEAIGRITSRLPSAIWFEAGSSTPIVAMARRMTSLKSGRSDVFIPMELGNADAISNLAKAACQLWTAGSTAQHWLFHQSSRHRYKNINLPPYQFDKTSHWIQWKPRSEPKNKVAPSLVTLLNNDGATAGDHIFAVDTANAVFELAARGHAVTGQSLCPASMYIELAARCVMAMRGADSTVASEPLPHVQGLTMSAPLGLGAEASVFLRLHQNAPQTWDFSVFSRPLSSNGPSQVAEKETEHAKGSISSVAAGEPAVERLLKLLQRSSTHRTRNLPSATGINGEMVYKLFGDVVEYARYYQGVQSVSASGKEAVGSVRVPHDQPSCLETSICDPISLDNFLQVAGIHVNCLSHRDDDQVFMCTAVEEIIFSSSYMATRGGPSGWTVHTSYELTSKLDMTNDIFVYDSKSGTLVLAIMGAKFRSVPLKSVARSLTRLNKAPVSNNVVPSLKPNASDELHDSAYQTRAPSPAGNQKELSKNTLDSPVRQPNEIAQPATKFEQKFEQTAKPSSMIPLVCKMFSEILEIPVEEIGPTASLEELGIDSLLVTEVISEIETRFYASLEQANLMACPDVLSVAKLIKGGDLGEDSEEPISTAAGEHTVEILTNGHSSDSDKEKSLPIDRLQKEETDDNLAVVSHASFTDAKATYDANARRTGFEGFCTEAFPLQSKLVVQYVVNAFTSLNCDLETLKPGDKVPAFKFDPKHEKLIPQLHKILEDARLVNRIDGTFYRTEETVPTLSTTFLLDELLEKFPKHTSETKLLYTTGHRLADCLSGAADPIGLIFRDSSARTLLEDVYTNAPMFKTGSLVLAQYLSKVLGRIGTTRELRILELGAGTGGTSKSVIDTLVGLGPQYKFSYTFTDLSPSLVGAAKRKFSKWPFMQYMTLDIEKDPSLQSLGAYDVILSTNCIHATKNLVNSCTNIRKMLRPDGILCLVELTRNLYWFDLVFGLLEGWWLFNDGREHALAHEHLWKSNLTASGFQWADWSNTQSEESDILRVITASPTQMASNDTVSSLTKGINGTTLTNGVSNPETVKDTVTFKKIDGMDLLADIYYPAEASQPGNKLPVALMIHGGGHIMLSRSDIRPEQTKKLLRSGFLPISIDYRLCPETTLIDGPMADVADALLWVRTVLSKLTLSRPDINIDTDKVVAIGWSTGGHLAMTLAWTAAARQIRPPEAILSFYCPTDYEDPFWMSPNTPAGAQSFTNNDTYELNDQLLEGLSSVPITGYNVPPKKRAVGGWLAPSDPRSRIALHMNMHGHTLHILLNGRPKLNSQTGKVSVEQPSHDRIVAASPLAQIQLGKYITPTFIVHPRHDDLIPWQQAERTWQALTERLGSEGAKLRIVEKVPHLWDVSPEFKNDEAGAEAIKEGYQFLSRSVGLHWCE